MLYAGRHAEFTEGEARALVGRLVETTAPFRRLPIRTRGRIISASLEIPQRIKALALWRVVVEWELPDHKAPVRDWIARWELEQYLQLVPE